MLSAERLPRCTKITILQEAFANAAHISLLREQAAKYSPKRLKMLTYNQLLSNCTKNIAQITFGNFNKAIKNYVRIL
jgi:hypothetical protein